MKWILNNTPTLLTRKLIQLGMFNAYVNPKNLLVNAEKARANFAAILLMFSSSARIH
ncbi:hypothetical protein C0J52_28286 [Blattella germanica]|nr:hypothetical protein C0J52_28286 [Blattella germanica]